MSVCIFTWIGQGQGYIHTLHTHQTIDDPTAVPMKTTGEEGDSCWYSALRHDGRCRARFDFADHGVLFISQYLTIQTFETLAVLREVGGEWWLV